MMEEDRDIFICINCNNEFDNEDTNYMDDEPYCQYCLDELTVLCSDCDRRIWRDASEDCEEHPLCNSCYNSNYTTCTDCGDLIRYDDACYIDDDGDEEEPYCYSCFNVKCKNQYINDYSYKPKPLFYGTGDRFFGLELELDKGGRDSSNAKAILDTANQSEENIYIKSDGSLEYGLEIVTHPMTLQYHLKEMPWEKVCEKALKLGYYSHKTSTCGLHIHVNKNCFGGNELKQDEAISKVLYFVENHWFELLKFSRRTQDTINRWAARYGRKDSPKAVLDQAKKSYSRYTCINLSNHNTIEFRIFRGTLRYNTLAATLQIVNLICDVAVFMSDDDLEKLSWSEFVENIDKSMYPELITYLKERNLYINEPLESMEEE